MDREPPLKQHLAQILLKWPQADDIRAPGDGFYPMNELLNRLPVLHRYTLQQVGNANRVIEHLEDRLDQLPLIGEALEVTAWRAWGKKNEGLVSGKGNHAI
ncbi:hypothetical protein D3C80_1967010 [compost metagenome]